ncbi:barstar family protein [Roseateles microcysteis]|uniref:barstar family protein n=1 Tax=Roseateles microcysteis TaxID=3119057 RepID=UPI002FE691A4
MRDKAEFIVELGGIEDIAAFASAFNSSFIRLAGGEWNGRSWDAFNDYLSWPDEDEFRLVLRGWKSCQALAETDREIFEEIIRDNPHVEAVYA